MRKRMRWIVLAGALAGAVAAAGAGSVARAAGLTLLRPKDGDTVRETVKIMIPRSSVPTNGFASLFVDGLFRVAQAPPTNSPKPITFLWDTKAKLTDASLPEDKKTVADGEHVIEVRTYSDDGKMEERAAANVKVANLLPIRKGQPIYLGYRFKVGDATKYAYRYDLKATGIQNIPGAAPTALPEIEYREFIKVTTFVEDLDGGQAFMRERRASPISISFGDIPQNVPIDESSRYYSMKPTGHVILSAAMTREKRFPMYQQLYLPGHSVRVGESWPGPVSVWQGTFATKPVILKGVHTLEAVEWEHGVPTARIKSTYKGTARLDNAYAGIQDGLIEVTGTSVFHYAPSTGKIVRVVHEMTGTLKLDTTKGTPGGGPGGTGMPGGYGGPGGKGSAPGYGGGGVATPSGYGGAGGAPGGPGGYPGPGGAPGAAPGYGVPGGIPGGAPGGPGGYGSPGGYGAPGGYDPTANQGGPIPGVPIYATYTLKIRAVATVA